MPHPVITVAQMREWEKVTWASGQTEQAVMRLAGQSIARRAESLTQPGDFILVVAGKGHNGDDASFAADAIRERKVELLRVIDPVISAKEMPLLIDRRPALIIDGLFGIGLNRSLSGAWLNLIDQINQAERPVLAVDVPSGLNADTGLPLDNAIHASVTVTLGAVKLGLLQSGAWPFVGRLEIAAEIGLQPYPFVTEINYLARRDFRGFPPPRPVFGHKGTFGHLAIIAGSLGFHGAAVLAARAALRAQPGLVTLCVPDEIYAPVAAQLQSVMVQPWHGEPAIPEGATAVLAGPGLAARDLPETLKRCVRRLWQDASMPIVVDATAMDWLPAGPCQEGAIRVITPHPGEAARLLQISTSQIQSDRFRAARELSQRWGECATILKGHQTLIQCGKEPVYVNGSGNPHLAQGGAGDLLAGYLAGLLAQPRLHADVGRLLRFGVWQHGASADALDSERNGWTIEDLAGRIGEVRP